MSDQLATIIKPTSGGALLSPQDLQNMKSVAEIFVEAGMFQVSEKEGSKGITPQMKIAQATVKIMAGQELGISPWAAMKGMHLVKDKCEPGYQILLAKVRSTPGYNYEMLQWDNESCRIEFFRNNKSLGISEFGIKEMQEAKLGGDAYIKYKKNMFVARATSNGVNALCPEVTMGPVYTPADFGYVEDDQGNLINCEEPDKSEKKSTARNATPKPATSAKPEPTVQIESVATAEKISTTPQNSAPSEEPTDAEIVQEAKTPDESIFDQILQAGVSNGWSEADAENWMTAFLSDNGIDLSSNDLAKIAAQMTFQMAEKAINFFLTNKK